MAAVAELEREEGKGKKNKPATFQFEYSPLRNPQSFPARLPFSVPFVSLFKCRLLSFRFCERQFRLEVRPYEERCFERFAGIFLQK